MIMSRVPLTTAVLCELTSPTPLSMARAAAHHRTMVKALEGHSGPSAQSRVINIGLPSTEDTPSFANANTTEFSP